ncbi:hypothetical protein ABIB14_002675 [Arthrobacter sp. UYEF3]
MALAGLTGSAADVNLREAVQIAPELFLGAADLFSGQPVADPAAEGRFVLVYVRVEQRILPAVLPGLFQVGHA